MLKLDCKIQVKEKVCILLWIFQGQKAYEEECQRHSGFVYDEWGKMQAIAP